MNDYFAKLRAKRKELGLCTSCGKYPDPCEHCRLRNREYMRRKRAGLPPLEKKKIWVSSRNYHLLRKFGITEEQYNKMLENQGNCCAICRSEQSGDKRTNKLSVDHCHKNKQVRGLLCSSCNKAIGLFRDNADFLKQAAKYLENHQKI